MLKHAFESSSLPHAWILDCGIASWSAYIQGWASSTRLSVTTMFLVFIDQGFVLSCRVHLSRKYMSWEDSAGS